MPGWVFWQEGVVKSSFLFKSMIIKYNLRSKLWVCEQWSDMRKRRLMRLRGSEPPSQDSESVGVKLMLADSRHHPPFCSLCQTPALHHELSATCKDCDWFKENTNRLSVFPQQRDGRCSQTFLQHCGDKTVSEITTYTCTYLYTHTHTHSHNKKKVTTLSNWNTYTLSSVFTWSSWTHTPSPLTHSGHQTNTRWRRRFQTLISNIWLDSNSLILLTLSGFFTQNYKIPSDWNTSQSFHQQRLYKLYETITAR